MEEKFQFNTVSAIYDEEKCEDIVPSECLKEPHPETDLKEAWDEYEELAAYGTTTGYGAFHVDENSILVLSVDVRGMSRKMAETHMQRLATMTKEHVGCDVMVVPDSVAIQVIQRSPSLTKAVHEVDCDEPEELCTCGPNEGCSFCPE